MGAKGLDSQSLILQESYLTGEGCTPSNELFNHGLCHASFEKTVGYHHGDKSPG